MKNEIVTTLPNYIGHLWRDCQIWNTPYLQRVSRAPLSSRTSCDTENILYLCCLISRWRNEFLILFNYFKL